MNWNNCLQLDEFPNYYVNPRGQIFNSKGVEKKQSKNMNGYSVVVLYKDNKRTTKSVHRLVVNAFIPNPNNKPEVNHIDGNKNNNEISNLEWNTRRENQLHAYAHNLRKNILTPEIKKLGAKRNAELTKQAVYIPELGKTYESLNSCSKELGLPKSSISRCCNGTQKKCNEMHFEWVEVD